MSRKYVIAVKDLTPDEEKRFIKFITDNGGNWWHWVQNFWLVVDAGGTLDAGKLRDAIGLISSRKGHNLVFQVMSMGDWAGFGPSSEKKSMFNWLRNNWF